MNPHHVWLLYRRELRAALRERSVVVNSVLLPIFLYPFVLWLTFTGVSFAQGLAEGYVSRVAVGGEIHRHAGLLDSLRHDGDVELREDSGSPAEARAAVRAGELDALLEFLPPARSRDDAGSFRARISYDRSERRSERARERLEGLLERERERRIVRRGEELGLSPGELAGFRVESRNVAPGGEMGAFLLAELIPVILVVMVALGCFVPAVDSTAGERERGTWETLMTIAASRSSVVWAKYLYVATLGSAAGVLNILAMTASIGAVVGPLTGAGAGAVEFDYPAAAVPVMVAGSILLALFFAAAMMILASFARTFRDGQSMVTPVYWLAVVPLVLGQAPDQHLSAGLALVPIVNVALMIRDAIQGVFSWLYMVEAVAVGVVVVVLCLRLARWILSFEDVLVGSYDGSFWRFLRERARS